MPVVALIRPDLGFDSHGAGWASFAPANSAELKSALDNKARDQAMTSVLLAVASP